MSERMKNVTEKLNFLVAYLLVFFIFFGFICNLGLNNYLKEPGDRLMYVYLNFFSTLGWNWAGLHPPEWLGWIESIPGWSSIFLLFLLGASQVYREDFLFYGMRNNLVMIPLIIVTSWIFYAINYQLLVFDVIRSYFVDGFFHWILNIIVISIVYIGAGFCGGWLKIYKNKKKTIGIVAD